MKAQSKPACPCCGLHQPRAYHLAVAQECIRYLQLEEGSLNQAAQRVADRTGRTVTAAARLIYRVLSGQPPSERTLDELRTMTVRLAPYQVPHSAAGP